MCDPASIALTIGGTLVQKMGQDKARKAGRNAQIAETTRQDKLADEARAALNVSVDDFGDTETDMQAAAAKIGERIQAAMVKAKGGVAIPDSQTRGLPAIVKSDIKGREADGAAEGKANARRQANVSSFGHTVLDKNAGLVQNRNIVDMITGLQNGSLNVLPLELEAAQQKGSGLRMIGDIAKLAGATLGARTLNAPIAAVDPASAPSLYPGFIDFPAP